MELAGELQLSNDAGAAIRVVGERRVLSIRAERSRGLALPRFFAGGRDARRLRMEGLQRALRHLGVSVELRIANRLVARLGPDTRPGLASALLALGPTELKLPALLSALLAR